MAYAMACQLAPEWAKISQRSRRRCMRKVSRSSKNKLNAYPAEVAGPTERPAPRVSKKMSEKSFSRGIRLFMYMSELAPQPGVGTSKAGPWPETLYQSERP